MPRIDTTSRDVNRNRARDLAQRLAKNIDVLALDLLGEPSLRTSRAWRWGTHGSFIVNVEGPRRGRWYSFEEELGGDALDLVRRHHGTDLREAIAWAKDWLGDAS